MSVQCSVSTPVLSYSTYMEYVHADFAYLDKSPICNKWGKERLL